MAIEEITDYQKQKFAVLIEDLFPEPDDLEMLLFYNSEAIGIKTLNKISGNNDKYPFKIRKLLEYLIPGKITIFLDIATKGKDKDIELVSFKKYYCAYWEHDFKLLINALKEIDGFDISTYGDIDNIDDIVYSLLTNTSALNSFIIENEKSIIKRNIEEFAQRILNENKNILTQEKNSGAIDDIQKWLEKNGIDFKLNLNKNISPSENNNYNILITIEPLSENKFSLKAELYSSLNNEQCKKVNSKLEEREIDSIEKIPNEINYFIEIIQAKLPCNNLFIELFVGLKLLGKMGEPSMYKVTKNDMNDMENLLYNEDYDFVVRSLERAKNSRYSNNLKGKWESFEQSSYIEDITELVCPQIKTNLANHLNIHGNKNSIRKVDNIKKVGFKICADEIPEDKEPIFRYMLDKGIPLCIWMKDLSDQGRFSSNLFDGEPEKNTGLNQIFSKIDVLEHKIKDVLKQIKIFRSSILCDKIADDLVIGILYDNPHRIPIWLENQLRSE